MKIALPVWQDRVSPLFDSSRRVLIVDIADGRAHARAEFDMGGETPERVRRLNELGADTLICGAISEPLAEQIIAAGIRLIPFITGEVKVILKAFLNSRLPSPEFLMPGCCGNRHRERIGRHGCRNRGAGEREQ